MRKVDKPLFFIGLILILLGLVWNGISSLTSKKSNILPTPTIVVSKTTPSPVASSSAALPAGRQVLGEKNYIEAQVIKIVDGDTIHVLLQNKDETIRLIGVDTPETVDPRKKVQCFGKEASIFTKGLLDGKTVFLQIDSTQGDRDKYQRFLRYVFLQDGTNFNKMLIQQGYAYEYTYRYPYKYQEEFKQAEKEARENNRGLWSTCR